MMLKLMNLIILFSILLFIIAKNSYSNNIECTNKLNDIVCNYIISVQKSNASDLGTYNININLIKIKEISGVLNANMTVSAGLCNEDLKIRVKEKIQIAQSLKHQSYNFPLYLHKKVIIADFCVKLLMNNCIDTCGDLIRLEGMISPIMQMQKRR